MTAPAASVVQLLRDLIAIPSVNPDGIPPQDGTGEHACAEYVRDFLERCGAEVWLDEVQPGRPNAVGRFPGPAGAPRVLLGPHLDTVTVDGMTIDPFGAELRDGRVWGRGASDTKGSVAAMLWALWELREVLPKRNVQVTFVGFMGEESAQHGSRHFVAHHQDEIDFAIVGEPTGLDVVHAHKACWWIEMTASGKAVHGSRPELGDNAILKLADAVVALEREFPDHLRQFDDPVLGRSTISVNLCRGGTRANIVPDRATFQADVRATPGLFEAGIVEVLRSFLSERGVRELEFRVVGESPTLKTDPEHPMVRRLKGMGSEVVTAPWFCDAGWLSRGGIPAVALGPGSIEQAHTKEEWISVSDLEAGAAYFRRFLDEF